MFTFICVFSIENQNLKIYAGFNPCFHSFFSFYYSPIRLSLLSSYLSLFLLLFFSFSRIDIVALARYVGSVFIGINRDKESR